MKPCGIEVKTAFDPAMTNQHHLSLAEQLAATQDWWRAAGVDFDYLDEAKPWLKAVDEPEEAPARPAALAPAEEPAEPPPPQIAIADLPQDLAAFRAWWSDPASEIPGAVGQRIAPCGDAGAKLMLIVGAPEPDARASEADALLQGPQGRLLANILRALGLTLDNAYCASALPGPMAEPDWNDLNRHGLGTILAHHIALARPERVLLLGSALPLLLGHDADAPPEGLTRLDSPAGKLPVLTTFAPDRLLGHARQRARLWHRLLDWME